jgi:hypothetical protein
MKTTINNKEIDIEAIKAILTEEQIKELTRERESGVFVPKLGEEFYLATGCMDVKENFYNNNNMDLVIDNFLVYRTEAEARKAQKRNQARIRIIRKIAELNASVWWKVDWGNNGQQKNFLCFSGIEEVGLGDTYLSRHTEDYFYFSGKVVDQVLEACAEDYKIMLGIK